MSVFRRRNGETKRPDKQINGGGRSSFAKRSACKSHGQVKAQVVWFEFRKRRQGVGRQPLGHRGPTKRQEGDNLLRNKKGAWPSAGGGTEEGKAKEDLRRYI